VGEREEKKTVDRRRPLLGETVRGGGEGAGPGHARLGARSCGGTRWKKPRGRGRPTRKRERERERERGGRWRSGRAAGPWWAKFGQRLGFRIFFFFFFFLLFSIKNINIFLNISENHNNYTRISYN
jgi:hypothetical protein